MPLVSVLSLRVTMRTAAALMIGGSIVFLVGAAIGVPGVFMVSDAEARLALLRKRMAHWKWAQLAYSAGPLLAVAGVGLLAPATSDDLGAALFLIAAATMAAGGLTWTYDCYLRGRHPADFAYGKLPGWPFAVYVPATIAGIGLAAAGLAASEHSGRLWGTMLAADAGFLAFYIITRDIPPFFFYTLLLVVGAVLYFDAPG